MQYRLFSPPFITRALVASLTPVMALWGPATQADTAAPALEEVLVTAQRRTESLEDVPISVVAMGEKALAMRAVDELEDLTLDIPNFTINTFPVDSSTVRLFIRGIGQNDAQITQDPSVALYLDGVYIGTSVGAGFEGVDVERIEVLRGPQGTLYGRNATGGAVNIITRRASVDATEFRQELTAGNLDKWQSKTMLNLPFGETVAAKVNYNRSTRVGLVENTGSGEDFSNEDRSTVVADLRWLTSDALILDYRFEDARLKDSEPFNQILTDPADSNGVLAGSTTFYGGYSPDRLDKVASLRNIPSADQHIFAHTVWAQWELNDQLRVENISAYRKLNGFSPSDILPTAVTAAGAPAIARIHTNFEQWSQELQLLGSADDWDYVSGVYYYQDKAYQDNTDGTILGVTGKTDSTDAENWSAAVFSQATWNPPWMEKRWRLTLGGRYSVDQRQADRDNQAAVSKFTGSYDKDFDNFSPSLIVAYDVHDHMNAYGKIETGYKAGGTSMRSANATLFAQGFDPEEIVSYELGLKGTFWNGRGRYSSALFYMELDGLQTSFQTDPISPGGRDFVPVDGTDIPGAELDLSLLLLESLTFSLSYGYIDPSPGESAAPAELHLGETVNDTLPYAPRNSVSTTLNYTVPLPLGALDANLNYGWQDDVDSAVLKQGNYTIGAYGLLGAGVSWSGIPLDGLPGEFRVLLWGRNLLDEEYANSGQTALQPFGADEAVFFGEPRTYGLTLSYQY